MTRGFLKFESKLKTSKKKLWNWKLLSKPSTTTKINQPGYRLSSYFYRKWYYKDPCYKSIEEHMVLQRRLRCLLRLNSRSPFNGVCWLLRFMVCWDLFSYSQLRNYFVFLFKKKNARVVWSDIPQNLNLSPLPDFPALLAHSSISEMPSELGCSHPAHLQQQCPS